MEHTLPRTPSQWMTATARQEIWGDTINATEVEFESGSKTSYDQFLLTQTVWPIAISPFNFKPRELNMNTGNIEAGKAWLTESLTWYKYLLNFDRPASVEDGVFALVKNEQQECNPLSHFREERSTGQVRKVALNKVPDEQIVNCALILFLNALSLGIAPSFVWTMERISFKPVFQGDDYTAIIDGYLKERSNRNIRAIVETKRDRRFVSLFYHILIALVGGQANHILLNSKYVLIAQNREGIYLVFPRIWPEYKDYLAGKPLKTERDSLRRFMVMQEVGPWLVTNKEHMEKLGHIIIAIVMTAQDGVRRFP
ncbi:hypothetical protein F5884DRAFT_760449 [Xylogone sp. PMI_703]|nr:hypothetical protein F5884DRAFT_760449 [Xylogone sp. PMI_703]